MKHVIIFQKEQQIIVRNDCMESVETNNAVDHDEKSVNCASICQNSDLTVLWVKNDIKKNINTKCNFSPWGPDSKFVKIDVLI